MARILITSALPYINGIKHLGNLVGSMLPSDVYARFKRGRGDEVLFICATDEHGTPAEIAATEAGQAVEAYCAEQHEIQRQAGAAFGLSFDHFGRSSSKENHALTQYFAHALERHGFIEERSDKQIYSCTDERFLPDRYIEGTCPNCAHPKARGDQCDNCGQLLDPTELISPYSVISGSTDLEIRETRHLYLLQSKLQTQINDWVSAQTHWPSLTSSIARKWLKEGLRDRAITRDLSWGIPVAYEGVVRPGFEDKVFYVWFDAPIAYIAATKAATADWESWWREDKGAADVTYVEVMGKDNVAFHTVSFPCTVIGSGEPFKKVDILKSLNWLTWYGGKFSTSQNLGIFMDEALEILPADYWRWYLLANAPESDDTSFTLEAFAATVNKDLADVLGNFVNRVTRFCHAKFGTQLPAGHDDSPPGPLETELARNLGRRIKAYTQCLEAMEYRKACAELRAIWALGNEYLAASAPWSSFKEDPGKAALTVRYALNLIPLYSALSAPILPYTAIKLAAIFDHSLAGETDVMKFAPAWPEGIADVDRKTDDPTGYDIALLSYLVPDAQFTLPDVLFAKIQDDEIQSWRARFNAP